MRRSGGGGVVLMGAWLVCLFGKNRRVVKIEKFSDKGG